ncbi:MAG: NTP transferase domain-containing protein [Helicobacteraceae bacterium]|nr:NTP transferase domain-containing protein [Helicobacteraceae bacterium]
MKKLFIIIQARLNSTRLPNKVLLPLCGKTVLEVLLDRLSIFKNNIIVATTADSNSIVNICKKNSIKYFIGSQQNVLERYYLGAKEFGADANSTIVRITSDCPFNDSTILERLIAKQREKPSSYIYVDIENYFPRGFDAEAFSFKILENAYLNATTDYDKEHVTPFIKRINCKKVAITDDVDNSNYRLTLDTEDDYIFTKELYKELNYNISSSYEEIISTLKKNPQIVKINADIKQKTT